MNSRWPIRNLGEYTKQTSLRNRGLHNITVYSVTNSQGFTRSEDYFNKEVFSKDLSNYKIVKKNEFAYNPSRINVGSIACLTESEEALISPLYIVFSINLQDLHPGYLLRYLKSNNGIVQIKNNTQGSVRDSLKYEGLEKIQIPLPPLPEQIAIANILSKAEALIAKRKESLALLDAYLKSTFLEMFGDPVRNEKGWEVKRFSEIVAPDCPLTYGIVQPGEEFKDGVIIVRPVDLTSDIIHSHGLKRIDPKIEKKYRRTRLKGGELLMCVRGTTGVVSIAGEDLKDANVTRGITPIWFTDNFNNLFALSQIKSQSMQKKIQEKTYGIALKQINLRDVRIIEFIAPPLELQNQFAAVVEKVEALKEKYQKSLGELENLYGSLSQRAFRGDLGVGGADDQKDKDSKANISEAKQNVVELSFDQDESNWNYTSQQDQNIKYSKNDLIEFLRKNSGETFSFEEIWNKIENLENRINPSRIEIQKDLLDMLESDNSIIEQIYEMPKYLKENSNNPKQILFRVKI